MSSSSWRNETEGRLRKAQVSLEAARALIERKPPCIDDAVNRASAAALQAARALVDARWPPIDGPPHDPTWRPGMAVPAPIGPYSKASWPVIVQQFEKASAEMALPFDATEYLRTLVEDGHIADVGDMAAYEPDEANEAVLTADKLVRSVTQTLPLAFALGYREMEGEGDFTTEDDDENATTLEVMPVSANHEPPASHPPVQSAAAAETDPHLEPLSPPNAEVKPAAPASDPASAALAPAVAVVAAAAEAPPAVDAPVPSAAPAPPVAEAAPSAAAAPPAETPDAAKPAADAPAPPPPTAGS